MSYPYVTKQELERELPFTAADFGLSDSDWADLLTEVIEREADRVEEWVGTKFDLTTVTEDLDGSGTSEQPIPNRPVDSVSSLSVDDGNEVHTIDTATEIYVAETHIELLDDAPIETFTARSMRRNVSITYDYGYDGAPAPIQGAITRLARKALDMIETDGVRQESEGSFSYTYQLPAQLRATVRSEVKEYRPPSYYGGIQLS